MIIKEKRIKFLFSSTIYKMKKLIYINFVFFLFSCASNKGPSLVNAHKDPNQKEISKKINDANHKKSKSGIYTFY